MYKGIDISNHNGRIDWDTVKDHIDFAIIRVGWGSDYSNQDDPDAEYNMGECERLGVPYGVYLYSYALTNNEAASEASHALRKIAGRTPELGIWFDMEDADGYKKKHGINVYDSRELLTDFCIIFCDKMKEAGYKTGIYANKDYFSNVLLSERLQEYDNWLAHWGIDEPSMPCLLWQYTSDGSISGIPSSRVDMNYYYGELTGLDNTDNDEEMDTEENIPDTKYHAGDSVKINKIFVSSTSDKPLNPVYTDGRITRIIPDARNPYLINDGLGWVNDDCIVTAVENAETSKPEICSGDSIRVLNAEQYNGGSFSAYYDQYEVMEVSGDRVVIGVNGTVTAAINICNIEKI